MITVLADLGYEDVFEEISTGRLMVVKNFEGAMAEVKEVGRKRFWAWPLYSQVRLSTKKSWEQKNR